MSELAGFDFNVKASAVKSLVNTSNPADGTHIYAIRFCGPDLSIGNDPVLGVSIVYQKMGTVELVDSSKPDAAVGSMFKENFTGHEMAMKVFKLRMEQIFGPEIIQQLEVEDRPLADLIPQLDALRNTEWYVQLVTKIVVSPNKKDPKKPGWDNVRIQDLTLVSLDSVEVPDTFEYLEYEPSLPEAEEE